MKTVGLVAEHEARQLKRDLGKFLMLKCKAVGGFGQWKPLSAVCHTAWSHSHTPDAQFWLLPDHEKGLFLWPLCSRCTQSPAGPVVFAQHACEWQVWRGYGPNEFFPYAPKPVFPLVQSPSITVWAVPSSWRRAQRGLAGAVLLPLALQQIVGSGRPRDGSKTC